MKSTFTWSALAGLAGLTMTTASISVLAEPPKLVFPKDRQMSVTVTLLPLAGKVGRDRPFYNGYRPQLRFDGMRTEVTCALTLPEPRDKVEPGETADVGATCIETLRVAEDQLDFGVYEGGRKVGQGRLKP